MKYEFFPESISSHMPKFYHREAPNEFREAIAYVKFFTPDSNWTWYASEYDPEKKMFFGLVEGLDTELGYFSLEELQSVRGPLGLKIERDIYFEETPLSQLQS